MVFLTILTLIRQVKGGPAFNENTTAIHFQRWLTFVWSLLIFLEKSLSRKGRKYQQSLPVTVAHNAVLTKSFKKICCLVWASPISQINLRSVKYFCPCTVSTRRLVSKTNICCIQKYWIIADLGGQNTSAISEQWELTLISFRDWNVISKQITPIKYLEAINFGLSLFMYLKSPWRQISSQGSFQKKNGHIFSIKK